MPVYRDESGQITAIICSRGRAPKRCAYCGKPSDKLCDGKVGKGNSTCSKPMCSNCSFHVEPDSDYCKMCRPGMEKAEPQKKEHVPGLIFIAQSRYRGACKDKDCCNSWQAGDPIYWHPETRDAYCEGCGQLMLETERTDDDHPKT